MTIWRWPAVGLALALVLVLSACSDSDRSMPTPPAALRFSLLDGSKPSLADYSGRWLLINFWSVSCPPCFKEMPELVRLRNTLDPADFSLVGVAMPYDRPDSILEAGRKMALNYAVSLDLNGDINLAFGRVSLIPQTFLLNPRGEVVWQHAGVVTYEQIIELLDQQQDIYQGSN